jgi:ribosomal protein S18 acetylase RimI-like enzyme
MRVTIRSAESKDEAEVVELWRTCDLVASYNDPSADFRFAKDGACSEVLIAEDDVGRVIGSVMVGHDGHRGWLYYLASAERSRRCGVGRALVSAAEEWLRQRDVMKAQLLVRETNTGVIPFYERMGYEVTPRVLLSKWLERAIDQTEVEV